MDNLLELARDDIYNHDIIGLNSIIKEMNYYGRDTTQLLPDLISVGGYRMSEYLPIRKDYKLLSIAENILALEYNYNDICESAIINNDIDTLDFVIKRYGSYVDIPHLLDIAIYSNNRHIILYLSEISQ